MIQKHMNVVKVFYTLVVKLFALPSHRKLLISGMQRKI